MARRIPTRARVRRGMHRGFGGLSSRTRRRTEASTWTGMEGNVRRRRKRGAKRGRGSCSHERNGDSTLFKRAARSSVGQGPDSGSLSPRRHPGSHAFVLLAIPDSAVQHLHSLRRSRHLFFTSDIRPDSMTILHCRSELFVTRRRHSSERWSTNLFRWVFEAGRRTHQPNSGLALLLILQNACSHEVRPAGPFLRTHRAHV